jgi:hypothetical protein
MKTVTFARTRCDGCEPTRYLLGESDAVACKLRMSIAILRFRVDLLPDDDGVLDEAPMGASEPFGERLV